MSAPPPRNKWLVTLSVTFGTLMGAIDTSIVNVAVPHLRGAMGATLEQITWVTTGFVIATVMVMPLTGFIGRLFGQKRVYMFCLALFVAGSALCGLARSLPLLVLFRMVQGLGAGALQPTEQAILRQTFPPEEQGMAMALFGMAVVLGPAFGPTLGGYIVDNYSWPWIFYINLPVGALSLFMVSRFVHEPEDVRLTNQAMAERQRRNMDWLGIGLMVAGLGSMQFVLEEGGRKDWFQSGLIVGLTFLAVLAIVLLIVRELSAPVPAIDLSLFRDPVFASGTIVGAIMFAMLLSMTFLLPVFMQEMLGFDATQSGLLLMPRSLVMLVTMPIVGRIYNKVSPRATIAFGILLFMVSSRMMGHYTLATGNRGIISVLAVQGVAFACLFIPLTTLALANVPRHRLADATGLNSLMRQIGGSVGLAVFATLLTRYGVQARASLSAHVAPGAPGLAERMGGLERMFSGRGMDAGAAHLAALQMMSFTVERQAMVLSFERVFVLAGIAFACVLPLVWLLKAPPGSRGPSAEVHVEM
jgi:MFS transporter, DHA2 family, multidrug resistance protein